MKKNRLFVGLISLVSLLAITGCNNSQGQSEARKIELVHQFVKVMQVDQSSYLTKGFKTSFTRDYEVSYISNGEKSDVEYSLKHSCSGESSRFYEATVSSPLDSRYDEGRGYFAGKQSESVNFLRKVTDKRDNTVENRKANYDFNHNFGIKYDSTHLSVSGTSVLNNKLRVSNSASNEFKGRIPKDTLGAYSNDYLDSVVDDVLYLDAWDDVFTFINYRMDYYQSTAFESDDSIRNLIDELSFTVSESDARIGIDFKINAGKVIKDLYDKDITSAGLISGKIYISKVMERIDSYEYDLKDYFSAVLSLGSQNKEQYSYAVNSFRVKGLNLDTTFDLLPITGPLNDYSEDNASVFSNLFNQVIVPHLDNVFVIDQFIVNF